MLFRSLSYNMEEFLTSSVKLYLELAGEGTVLHPVETPFVDEDDRGNTTRQPHTTGPALQCPWCAHTDANSAFQPNATQNFTQVQIAQHGAHSRRRN